MIFIGIDASSGAAPSVAGAATIRAACRRLVHGRQTSGGKGANPFSGPYGGTQVFLDDGPRESANPLAENAEIPGTHHGMSGGKGGKGGNLELAGKTGPADDAPKRRKPAETGGNPFGAAYSGGKVFLEGLRETARALAEIAENAEITKAAVGAATPTTSSPLALIALTAPTCFRSSGWSSSGLRHRERRCVRRSGGHRVGTDIILLTQRAFAVERCRQYVRRALDEGNSHLYCVRRDGGHGLGADGAEAGGPSAFRQVHRLRKRRRRTPT